MKKKENIMLAAIKLFTERGYDGTTISMIAKEANVSVGLMYRYFESKEELINTLFKNNIDNIENHIKINFPFDKSIKEKFDYCYNKIFDYCKENLTLYLFMQKTSGGYYLTEESREKDYKFFEYIFSIFDEGKKQGIIKNIDNKLLLALIYGPIEIFISMEKDKEKISIEKFKNDLRKSTWNAIKNK